jgi:hypothetical protein
MSLTELMKKYGTDQWYYAYVFERLLGDKRESIKKVLEMGIGCQRTMRHMQDYKVGSGLYVWRDYFPNAQIYGADVLPETMFEDERIKTFLCDQRIMEDLVSLVNNTGSDIDLFIDDASHSARNQVNTCKMLKPLLKKDVIYIIEDVKRPNSVCRGLKNRFNCEIVETNNLAIITNKI